MLVVGRILVSLIAFLGVGALALYWILMQPSGREFPRKCLQPNTASEQRTAIADYLYNNQNWNQANYNLFNPNLQISDIQMSNYVWVKRPDLASGRVELAEVKFRFLPGCNSRLTVDFRTYIDRCGYVHEPVVFERQLCRG
jgi:hypothetical protein